MTSRWAERFMSGLGVCILVGAIAIFGDRDRLTKGDTYGQEPVARVAASGLSLQRMTMELPDTFAAYANGNPMMVMYGLASLSLILLMLRE